MFGNLLQTKMYRPRLRPSLVPRPHLIEKLNRGLHRKLTLISAPAGFGKTTLISEWIAGGERPFAWLSLDERDNDLARFLTYLVAALQTAVPGVGQRVLRMLESPQLPPTELILTSLLNEIAAIPNECTLILDDYHVIEAQPIDQALTFLLEHLPPHLHLVITTREDPNLPLARLRVRGQLTELRATDLRFMLDEAVTFLNQMMGLNLAEADVAALEARTEGWIAGLQLAALSMQGQKDAASFIQTFTGSHRFVLDYLVEEVLQRQSPEVHTFLLHTSILDRLCGSLCDAVVGSLAIREQGLKNDARSQSNGQAPTTALQSQEILESLERANLFLVPLDNERRWFRYHHLFADLLRQRFQQSTEKRDVAHLHIGASHWFEENGLEMEAFHHAAAANDVELALRLIEGKGLPLYFQGEATPVKHWVRRLARSRISGQTVFVGDICLHINADWAVCTITSKESSRRQKQRCLAWAMMRKQTICMVRLRQTGPCWAL